MVAKTVLEARLSTNWETTAICQYASSTSTFIVPVKVTFTADLINNRNNRNETRYGVNGDEKIPYNTWIAKLAQKEVIQRRFNGSVDFYRNWNNYKKGFGSPSGEYWLGNDNIHLISSSRGHKLSIYLEDFEANFKYANYSIFFIGDERQKYRLAVMGFSGTTGVGDGLSFHSNQPFSTNDRDNDGANCPVTSHGAWWYENCHHSNLNGPYLAGPGHNQTALEWYFWKRYYSLKKTTMMIRRQ